MDSIAEMMSLAARNAAYDSPQMTGLGLKNVRSRRSVAPFGLRYDGMGAKGKGFFGPLSRPDGEMSSELSASSDFNGGAEYPLLVPTLNRQQINSLLNGERPSDDIYRRAEEHAASRLKRGLSPFAAPGELYYPLPTE